MAPVGKGGGKGGKGGDGAAALRAGAKGKKVEPKIPSRIQNARDLRTQFAEVQHSPDGADPQPLTMPKCCECSHCGWPVYPRESRVASRKTFERAGIVRDYGEKSKEQMAKKEEKAAAKAAAGGGGGADGEDEGDLDIGDDEDEEGSDGGDSIGTVEMLQSKVEEMEEKINELISLNASLEKENAELTTQVEDLEEALAAAEEKIELLEESEMRWREKNSVLRVENGELRLYITRLGSRIGDLETDMVKKLLEIKKYKEDAARAERRRTLMLKQMEGRIEKLVGAGMIKALMKIWQEDTAAEKLRRTRQEAEERRRREVGELRDQLSQEKQHVLSLDATASRLRGQLKAAAQRLLMKVMSTTQKPWADGHALKAWCGAHEVLKVENELFRTQDELKGTQTKLATAEHEGSTYSRILGEVTAELKALKKEHGELEENYAVLMEQMQEHLGAQGAHAADIKRKAEEKARLAREALERQIWAEAHLEMERLNKLNEEDKLRLEDQVAGLEAQLESIKRGMGAGKDDTDDMRVVPRGQGILCCGCLRQIVNRGVKQLPPVSMPTAKSPTRAQEKAKKDFFSSEMVGMPDPDDFLHSSVWSSRRDPLKGLRYADMSTVSTDVSWQGSSKSTLGGSTSLPSLSRMKQDRILKPSAFR